MINSQKKEIIKLIPFFEIVICNIFLIVSFIIKDFPSNPTYTYINNCIVTHSWHDIYSVVLVIAFFIIVLATLVCIAIWIIEKIKNKEKNVKQIFLLIISLLFCSITLIISDIIVEGFWTDDDYSPSYYKFSDNKHTIVIEERSSLLYGGGTIYQINDDNSAVIIHEFQTDDGGRNNGHYEIKWHDDYAEITYNTFNSDDNKCTDNIIFR